ncbi:MAG: MarR family winged helix-turn-helix transcriptional regulator [Eubacteriales bacterium]|nr:MarR family winged helix-turn-helix transcriptional regulator [Eubacteriales bacterium]
MEMAQYQKTIKETSEVFLQLMQTYQFCTQRTLRKYGLYPGQPALLQSIAETDRPTQNDLAARLGISKASVGISLRRLEKAGFVKRSEDKTDSRCNRITLTKKGEEFNHWCKLDVEMIFTTMLEGFEGDERQDALETLRQMLSSMQNMKERMTS